MGQCSLDVCSADGREPRDRQAFFPLLLASTRSARSAAAEALRRLGARVVAGDLSQAETLVPHLKDVDGVCFGPQLLGARRRGRR